MKNLLKFLVKYHFGFMFLFLELIALLMMVQFNNYHQVSFFNSSNFITGTLFSMVDDVKEYGYLSKENQRLVNENARLKEVVLQFQATKSVAYGDSVVVDSLKQEMDSVSAVSDRLVNGLDSTLVYTMNNAKVINNCVSTNFNYLTLDKGSKDGLKVDQGVMNDQGIVGVITSVSKHYAVAISLLNKHFKLSSKVKKNDYYGSLSWDGESYRHAQLNEIPFHVDIQVGDTIVTSGYSSIFPEGIPVGVVSTFEKKGGSNFYDIDVELLTDFKSVNFVNIINYTSKEERITLEEQE
ncbi:rod shape-determining protein MreC [Halosquirtibacter xylanolyticus]|uniref:rod shape-determining protein MreC n=1 Tax=Halosquirtibacter xylanolyticus TaxID=3374599 RepID=UPI0037478E97|nr:rod shape-determining protein MreC [Prolixibacteraceae bacterium]